MVYFSKIAFHCIIKTCVTVHAKGNIWFPEGSYFISKDSIGFPKEIFGSPEGVICVSNDSIGFPKNIFGSSKEVSQIRVRVRQMMYVDQFEVFRCTNRSIMAAQRSQTSRFNVGFSGRNSEPTVKQPKEVFL